jgi:hypothetical protein
MTNQELYEAILPYLESAGRLDLAEPLRIALLLPAESDESTG